MKDQRLIIVVSAPSGVGKTTVIRYLLNQRNDLTLSVSATTRPPRLGERHGVDYYFLSEEEFKRKIENNEFVEFAQVHDAYYGTLREELEKHLHSGKDVILELDVQGMRSIKKKYPDAVSVFLLPPSLKEMEQRLRGRASESEEKIQLRIQRAKTEIQARLEFDYTIINYDIEQSAYDLNTIINAEHLRSSRLIIDIH